MSIINQYVNKITDLVKSFFFPISNDVGYIIRQINQQNINKIDIERLPIPIKVFFAEKESQKNDINYYVSQLNHFLKMENPLPQTIVSICSALYDFCEITKDWSFWENWNDSLITEEANTEIIRAGLGRIAEERDNLELAENEHIAGLALSSPSQTETKQFGLNLQGLGIIYMRENNPLAKKNLFNSMRVFNKLKLNYHLGYSWSNIGGHYSRTYAALRGNKKEGLKVLFSLLDPRPMTHLFYSIYSYKKAIRIYEKNEFFLDLPRIYYSLGFVLMQSRILRKSSYRYFIKAWNYAKIIGSLRYEALADYGIGFYFYLTKNFHKAIDPLINAHTIYTDISSVKKYAYYKENEFNIQYMLCLTYLELNNYDKFSSCFNSFFTTFFNEDGKKYLKPFHVDNLLIKIQKANLPEIEKLLSNFSLNN